MESPDDLVRQIISKSGIINRARRRELAAELHAHLEDVTDELRASGHDEASIKQIVYERFGNSEEIARAFANAYHTERTAAYAALLAVLAAASLVVVGTVISTVQLFVAIWSGAALPATFREMQWEFIGFLALTWGYVGIYLGERLFRQCQLISVVIGNACFFLPVALGFHYLAPGHVTTPAVAFVCAGMVRVLQRSTIRFIWSAGTAGPLLIAWLFVGPLVRSDGQLRPWEMGLVVWLGMTLSCLAMTSLTQLFDRKILAKLRLDY